MFYQLIIIVYIYYAHSKKTKFMVGLFEYMQNVDLQKEVHRLLMVQ